MQFYSNEGAGAHRLFFFSLSSATVGLVVSLITTMITSHCPSCLLCNQVYDSFAISALMTPLSAGRAPQGRDRQGWRCSTAAKLQRAHSPQKRFKSDMRSIPVSKQLFEAYGNLGPRLG